MMIKGVLKALHQKKRSRSHVLSVFGLLWVKLCLYIIKTYFFRATDLKVPEIIRMTCFMLSDWYSLTIKINVAFPCVAWGHPEIMFEGLLRVVGINLYSEQALK